MLFRPIAFVLCVCIAAAGLGAAHGYIRAPRAAFAADGAPARGRSVSDPGECVLLARVLRERHAARLRAGAVLAPYAGDELRCRWPGFGVRGANRGAPRETVLIGAPRYSLLRTRVLVPTGVVSGAESGGGESCLLSRVLTGWRLERCTPSWVI